MSKLRLGARIGPLIRRVSRPMIDGYGELNQDHNPVHYDDAHARSLGFRESIAHGSLVVALLSEMLTERFREGWLAGGTLGVKFVRPIYAEDTITADGQIVAEGMEGGALEWILDVWCENQSGERVIVGSARCRRRADESRPA